MPKTSFVDFKAVKAAVTMEQVLTHYGLIDKFKRKGDSLSGPCPIHKGSNPTQFRVSVSKNIWNCFSECKHGGNVLDFIAEMDNVSIHKAALNAIEWFGLDTEAMAAESTSHEDEPRETPKSNTSRPTATPKKAAVAPEDKTPNKPLQFRLEKLDRNHPYLAERGLSQETIIDFGVGFCAKGMMAGRIAIPIHNAKGEVVAYAGRWPGEPPDEDTERFKLPPGFKKRLELFNLDRAIKEPASMPLAIVEGFVGCMTIHQHGFRKVVGLMGSTMSEAQEALIREHFDKDTRIVLITDEDDAGRAGREDITARLAKSFFVKTVFFDQEDLQAEHLSPEELAELLGGGR